MVSCGLGGRQSHSCFPGMSRSPVSRRCSDPAWVGPKKTSWTEVRPEIIFEEWPMLGESKSLLCMRKQSALSSQWKLAGSEKLRVVGLKEAEVVYRDCSRSKSAVGFPFCRRNLGPEPQASWPQASWPRLPEHSIYSWWSEVGARPDLRGPMSQKGEWDRSSLVSPAGSFPAPAATRTHQSEGISQAGRVAPLPPSIRAWLCAWPTDTILPSFSLWQCSHWP